MKFGFPVELKASGVANSGEFEGYAASFGNIDLGGDVILPGAFAASLAEHKARATQPALLWSHDPSVVIGRVVELREDRKGLFTKGKLTLATKAAAEAYALLQDGAVGGMSIGYSIPEGGAKFGDAGRLLNRVTVHELSLVAVPMNPEARITAVKAMECADTLELKHLLRDSLGLSRSKSTAAAAALWPILHGSDSDSAPSGEAIAEVTKGIQELNQFLKGLQ